MPLQCLLRGFVLSAALASISAPCSAEAPPSRAADWAGVYVGSVPSPLGELARMVLVLQDDGRYQLMHDGRGAREAYAAQSQGPIQWEGARGTLLLGRGQRFRVTEGAADMLGPGGAAGSRLARQLRFTGPDGELLVEPASLRRGQPQPGWLSFSAIWNLPTAATNGTQSMRAHFEVNCGGDGYRLADVRSFSQAFLRGQPLATAMPGTPSTLRDTLVGQVARQHCRQ